MKLRFWKRRRNPTPSHPLPPMEASPPATPSAEIEAQTDRLIKGAMAGIGHSMRRSAQIREALAQGALELKGGK